MSEVKGLKLIISISVPPPQKRGVISAYWQM